MKKRIFKWCLIPAIAAPVISCITSCSIVDKFIQRARQVDGSDWIGRKSGLFVLEDDYEVDETNKTVTYWNMSELVCENLVVPNYVMWKGSEYKVLLDFSAFEDCANTLFGTIEMNDWFTDIPGYSFKNCVNITNVILHNYPETIGEFAFANCNSLDTIVVKKDDYVDTNWAIRLKTVESNAFDSCTISGKLVFGHALRNIGPYAFSQCYRLTEVDLSMCDNLIISVDDPDTETIGDGAFMNCDAITHVALPAWSTGEFAFFQIGNSAFSYCRSLKTISLANPNNERLSLDANALSHCDSFIGFTNSYSSEIIQKETNFQLCYAGEACFAYDKSLQPAYYLNNIGGYEENVLMPSIFSGCSFSTWTFNSWYDEIDDFAFSHNKNLKVLDFTAFNVGAGVPSGWRSRYIFGFGSENGIIKVKSGFISGASFDSWLNWFKEQGLSFNDDPTVSSLDKWCFAEQ